MIFNQQQVIERIKKVELILPPMHPKQREFYTRPERFVVGSCGSKFGKLQSIDTKVPTPSGFKTIGDLEVGDQVFSEDGSVTNIIDTTPIEYNEECYKITFSNGATTKVGKDHLWKVKSLLCRKAENRTKSPKDRCKSTNYTSEILNTEQLFNNQLYLTSKGPRPNYSIDLCKPLQFPEQDLPLDPLLLGIYLGDGAVKSGILTNQDPEILDAFRERGFEVTSSGPRKCDWYVRNLVPCLKTAGVYDRKHVPDKYLFSSEKQRMELLKGLMSTDGTISKRGDCTFDNTNEDLFKAVVWLASSLGIKVTTNGRYGKLNGVKKKWCYRVHFTTDKQVFIVKHKADRIRSVSSKSRMIMIHKVEKIPSIPVKCISVDHPSKMYLFGEYCIPTHNSFGGAVRMIQEAWNTPGGIFWWVAPSYGQCQIGVDEIKKYLPRGRYYHYKKQPQSINLLRADGSTYSRIEFKSADDPDNLRGFRLNMVLIDEADRISDESYHSVYTTLVPTQGRAFIISTPKSKNGFFYKEFCKGQKDSPSYNPTYFSMTMPTAANPWISPEILQQAKDSLPEDVYRTEYLAEWPSGDGGSVFRNFGGCILENAGLEGPKHGYSYVMGVDLAKHTDFTVLTVFNRHTRTVVHWERFNDLDWKVQKFRINEVARRYNNALVVMDTTGGSVGDVIIDDLRDTSTFPIIGYKISTNALKKQLVEGLKMALTNKTIFFPKIKQIIWELQMFEYSITEAGNVTYAACTGAHDDCVISMALGVHGLDQEPFVYRHKNIRGV